MAGKKIASSKQIEQLVGKIKKQFKPTIVKLFGSRTGKDYLKDSDWDLLIVSEKFEGTPYRERIDKILELSDKPIGQDIEPFCYTPKEINERKKQLGIINTALKTGIDL
ncbi:MAG: nucleotidyltransferase domain-containing protein [Candidatus Diapherotrites archaeon]|nr:nucleotidyltransferase domain-containing protein [Candidatus Diapherotrites archaeon]